MPITFYRYGRASFDDRALAPEEQAAVTRQEFLRQQATGALPADAIDGRFCADTDKTCSKKFLHRPMGIHLAMRRRPGDRICVAAYDRLIESTVDACETLDWAMMNQIGLVFLDLSVDSSTVDGKLFLDRLRKVKGYDRHEFRRRSHVDKSARRSRLLVSGTPPLGYEIKSIIPGGGRRPMKYYFPWVEERQYGERIVIMHDIQGLSFERIAVKLWKHDVVKPRSGRVSADKNDVIKYYHRCKKGWPLPGGLPWKPPAFKYLVAGSDAIDLTVDD